MNSLPASAGAQPGLTDAPALPAREHAALKPEATYALIYVFDPARAAQYAALVEHNQLSAKPARSIDEALFHVERLGPPALIIAEVRAELDGFGLLRRLRKGRKPVSARAVVIASSWELRREALEQRGTLGIAEVLAASQPVPTVEKAIMRALGREPKPQPRRSPSFPPAAREPGVAPEQPGAILPADAPRPLRVPGAEDEPRGLEAPSPQPERAPQAPEEPGPRQFDSLAPSMPPPASASAPADGKAQPGPPIDGVSALEAALQRTAIAVHAQMALAWLGEGHGHTLTGHFGWDPGVAAMVGAPSDWAPFRHLAQSAPVLVADAAEHKLLARSPLVKAGVVGSFAGAPLVDERGRSLGVLWVAHQAKDAFAPEMLEPLTLWAQRIGAEVSHAPPPRTEPLPDSSTAPEERFKSSTISATTALQQLVTNLDEGFVVTDDEDRIAFANPVCARLFGLRTRRITGLSRQRFIEQVRMQTDLSAALASRLSEARGDTFALELRLTRPVERVLKWETRPLPLDTRMGQMDRITDVTAGARLDALLGKLVRVDGLTWLGNRRSFDEAMARELARSLRQKEPVSLALFQLDGREALDTEVAERMLRDVGWLLCDVMRGYDHGARIDDDTLAAILPGATAKAALVFGARLTREVAELSIKGLPRLTLSGGVAQFDPGEDVDQLLSRARAAMLEAAACGGNGVL